MEKNLRELRPGEKGTIKKVNGQGSMRKRLLDMGATRGAEVYIRKVAPLGDPIEINLRGYELVFRRSEAENIIIE